MNAIWKWAAVAVLGAGVAGCEGGTELDTRTFELRYLEPSQVNNLVDPYVFRDREGAPGTWSTSSGALTVRETSDNLDKIERMLAEFDRPKPLVMLHFQVIRANGGGASDPAIAEIERELRRLFRFDGYELLAETRVGAMERSRIRQIARGGGEEFLIEGGVEELRVGGETPTLTLEISVSTSEVPQALMTRVTLPAGHAVVLGTAETETSGALILVVRAEIVGSGPGSTESDSVSGHTPAVPG